MKWTTISKIQVRQTATSRRPWTNNFCVDSGSDYEATRKAAEKIRQNLQRRGKETSDTELDDDEEDLCLVGDVVPEPGLSDTSRPCATTSSGKGKGKQRAKSSGPLRREGIEAAQALGERTMQEAQLLADKYGTSRRNILLIANLALKESRSPNVYNQHKEWYANHFPKSSGGALFCCISRTWLLIILY